MVSCWKFAVIQSDFKMPKNSLRQRRALPSAAAFSWSTRSAKRSTREMKASRNRLQRFLYGRVLDYPMTERVGFEPTGRANAHLISSQTRSTNSATSPEVWVLFRNNLSSTCPQSAELPRDLRLPGICPT